VMSDRVWCGAWIVCVGLWMLSVRVYVRSVCVRMYGWREVRGVWIVRCRSVCSVCGWMVWCVCG